MKGRKNSLGFVECVSISVIVNKEVMDKISMYRKVIDFNMSNYLRMCIDVKCNELEKEYKIRMMENNIDFIF